MATEAEQEHFDALNHEAVAYINRLGQFFYFAKAMKLQAQLSRTNELICFRHKYTAHRSIDNPRDETLELKEMQAMTFGFYHLSTGSFPVFQMYDQSKGQHVNFHMCNDHPMIMEEAMHLFQTIHAVASSA